jgi:hypothetical protein
MSRKAANQAVALKSSNMVSRLLNALACYTHRNGRQRCDFSYGLGSVLVGTVPLATAQERTDKLPFTVVAVDAIAAMDGNRELAIPPTFVNVVAK